MTYIRENDKNEVRRQRITFDRLSKTHCDFLNFVSLHTSPARTILDLGCGMGNFTTLLAETYRSYVEGWDASQRFITAAQKISKTKRIKVFFRKTNFFDDIPLDLKNKFDTVFFREAIMCVDKPINLLTWAKQLVTRNGSIAALEPDYGMTIIHPTIPLWNEFMQTYSRYCLLHGEHFSFGRSLPEIYLKAGMKDIAVLPISEIRTGLDNRALLDFMQIEVQSIKQDMESFVNEMGYGWKNVNALLKALNSLHRHSGAYVQTTMVAICGRVN